MKNFLNKFKYFILGGIVIMAGTIYAANLQPSFTPSLIPVEDSKYYLGTTTPSLRAYLRVIADSFYDTDASDGCAQWASNVLTSNGSDCGSGTVGSGTQGQFPFYNAAGTTLTATSTLFLSQAGNIGVGTTTPTFKLDVAGSGYISSTLFVGGAITATSTLNVTGLATFVSASTTNIGSTGSAYFATSGGNVGIGTTNPLSRLQLFTQVSTGVANPSELSLGGRFNNVTNGTNSAAKLKIYDDGVNYDGISISSVGGGFVQMEYMTHSGVDHAFYVAGSEKLRILSSNGNVGIGTTGPGAKFHAVIGGTAPAIVAATQTVGVFQNSANTTDLARVNITSGNAGTSILQLGDNDDDDIGAISYDQTSNFMSFRTNNVADRMVILSTGNVGIGTVSPDNALEIETASVKLMFDTVADAETGVTNGDFIKIQNHNGTNNDLAQISFVDGLDTITNYFGVKFTSHASHLGSFVWSNSSTELMRLQNDGNVGVGTTTPYSKFHVTSGASATTTVNFGEVGSAASDATKNTSGADISFYFVGVVMVIENSLCK